ncbi:MAG: segregation/condensation protein A [Planctomycetaceae bacterium]|nr:segregation/condensation protein A [Planctomycetaceae bacterium]
MILTDYRIDLGQYQGPMDLLLYLVRRHEVDICSISLSKITADFQQYIDVLEFLDFDFIGDFVVIASTLLEIKSREVLPVQEEEAQESEVEDDPGSGLIAKLLAYRKYKEATTALEDRAAEWLERYPRLSDDKPDLQRNRALDKIREVELWDLVSALSRVVKIPVMDREGTVRLDETPIGVFQERIRAIVAEEGRAAFSSFFDGEKIQSRIAGIFLAILELIRHEDYRAEQPVDFGEIWILPPHTPRPRIL